MGNTCLSFFGCAEERCQGSHCDDLHDEPDADAPHIEPADARTDDADSPDILTGSDAGPPPDSGPVFNESSCLPCGSGCGNGMCLTNQSTREQFCADACDADLSACAAGFTCIDIDSSPEGSVHFCVPPGASCRMTGVGFGAPCYGDVATCLAFQHHCEGDAFALGYCTEPCTSDADCPPHYLCGEGDAREDACKPRFLSNPERCAREGTSGELPCAIDSDCSAVDGALCVRSEPTLPGVCAVPCGAGGTCPVPGKRCALTARGELCLSEICACHGAALAIGERDLLGDALAQVGLSRCGAIFSVFDWTLWPTDLLSDPYRLAFFDSVHNEPLRAPSFSRALIQELDARAGQPLHPASRAARMLEDLARWIDRPAIRRPPGAIDPISPLTSAVASLIASTGGSPDLPALSRDAEDVPIALQLALAEIIDAVENAALARRAAIENQSPTTARALFDYGPAFVVARADGIGLDPAQPLTQRVLNDFFGYGHMYGAAMNVLETVARSDLSRFATAPTSTVATSSTVFLFAQDTPIGRVAIGDGESGIYDETSPGFDGPWALLLDLGGDDRYRIPVAGNLTFENSVSILIDLAGNDDYGYRESPHPLDGSRLPSDSHGRYTPRMDPTGDNGPISLSEIPRQGGARMGTAIHIDLGGGSDRYRSLRMSQGSGIFGAGVLVDDGGDDQYLAETMAQGAGAFGVGLSIDLGGNDVRRSYQFSQGFAFARAAGLSYDVSGDDAYLMDVGDPDYGGDPLYFSIQRPGRANSTLGQGFAFGRRADFTDRAFMSGGIGILVDARGRDRYEGSIFAQGGGFWFGTGILADEAGDDAYDAMWYGMGAGAHYALGLLLEGGGHDTYGGTFPRINVTIGSGHDYTAAFLIDESGDDTYNGGRITIGSGRDNGMGFFVDNGGNDRYSATSAYSIGAAGLLGSDVDFLGSPRRKVKVVGVFVDAEGMDRYEQEGATPARFGDESSWLQSVNPDPLVNLIERGSGIDGTGESTLHARWP